MPVGNFNLYDVLVDLVPGVAFIFLLVRLLQIDDITAGQGIGLLLIGYVVGRVIHAVGSLPQMTKLRIYLEEKLMGEYLDEREYGLSFRHRLMSYYNEKNDFGYEESDLESKVIKNAITKLGKKIDEKEDESIIEETEILNHDQISRSNGVESTDNILTLRYYGENYLFDKNTLYLQYEITSTFYRSLWVVSTLSIILYTAGLVAHGFNYVLLECTEIRFISQQYTTIPEVAYIIFFIPILFVIGYISLRQRIKFRFKKTRAFINDLHINLEDAHD